MALSREAKLAARRAKRHAWLAALPPEQLAAVRRKDRERAHAWYHANKARAKETGTKYVAKNREAFGVRFVAGTLSESEEHRAAELRSWKYDSIAWTRDGMIGARESRWGPVAPR